MNNQHTIPPNCSKHLFLCVAVAPFHPDREAMANPVVFSHDVKAPLIKKKIHRHFLSLWHYFPQTSACPPRPLLSHSPELSVWPAAAESKLASSAQWRAQHWNTGKFNLNVKKYCCQSFPFLVWWLSPWGQEGKSPRARAMQPWVGRALRTGCLLDSVAPEVISLKCLPCIVHPLFSNLLS